LSCNLKEQTAKDFENLQNVMSGEFTKDGQFNFGAKDTFKEDLAIAIYIPGWSFDEYIFTDWFLPYNLQRGDKELAKNAGNIRYICVISEYPTRWTKEANPYITRRGRVVSVYDRKTGASVGPNETYEKPDTECLDKASAAAKGLDIKKYMEKTDGSARLAIQNIIKRKIKESNE